MPPRSCEGVVRSWREISRIRIRSRHEILFLPVCKSQLTVFHGLRSRYRRAIRRTVATPNRVVSPAGFEIRYAAPADPWVPAHLPNAFFVIMFPNPLQAEGSLQSNQWLRVRRALDTRVPTYS